MYISYWLWYITRLEAYILIIPLLLLCFYRHNYRKAGYQASYQRKGCACQCAICNYLCWADTGRSYIVAVRAQLQGCGYACENADLQFGRNHHYRAQIVRGCNCNCDDSAAAYCSRIHLSGAIRATAQNKKLPLPWELIRIGRSVLPLASAGICCCSGTLFLPVYYVGPTVGHAFTTKAFIIVVLGGMGSICGASGGLVVGLVESIASVFMRNTLVEIMVFAIFIMFLFLKPQGLLGRKGC